MSIKNILFFDFLCDYESWSFSGFFYCSYHFYNMNNNFIHFMKNTWTKNIYSKVYIGFFMILWAFWSQVNAQNWECTINNLTYLNVYSCFVPSTQTGFVYSFRYTPNATWNGATAWNNAINMLTHAVRTSSWYYLYHNNRVWFTYSGAIMWNDGKWEKWETWATGPQWAQWIPWIQWNDWYSAFEIAQILWFTWNISEWQQSLVWATWAIWATGALDFSTLSWTINLQNVVNLPDNDWELNSWSTYIPIKTTINWVDYYDVWRLTQLLMKLLFILFIVIAVWYSIWKMMIKKNRYE